MANKGENILGEEATVLSIEKRGCGGKGQGVVDLWGGTLGELDAAVDTFLFCPLSLE